MKYNKREKQAIETLTKILKALNDKEEVYITHSDANSLHQVFGYDLLNNCFSKSEVKKFVRGKEDLLIIIKFYGIQGPYYKYCYFPFQVKENYKKENVLLSVCKMPEWA